MKPVLASLLALLVSSACASTPDPEPSGFLGEAYADLKLDRETGSLVYRKEGADLGRYSKVMLDRVQVWVDTEDRYKGASWMDVRRSRCRPRGRVDSQLRIALSQQGSQAASEASFLSHDPSPPCKVRCKLGYPATAERDPVQSDRG